jgi:hypothetical protein
MVGNGEELLEKTIEKILWEADEEIACASHLAKEAERGKGHNNLQGDLGVSDDDPRDDAPIK